MIENAHKHLEHWGHEHPGETLEGTARWHVFGESAAEVGPALVFSLLIITLSFVPVFTLEAQEGRLFSPLEMFETTIQFKRPHDDASRTSTAMPYVRATGASTGRPRE